MTTDEHFDAAVQNGGLAGDKRGTQPPATACSDEKRKRPQPLVLAENTQFAEIVALLDNCPVAEEGLEPPTRGL